MRLHELPLGVVELSGLVEHFGGNHELADVVQECSNAKPEERHGVAIADARPDGARQVGDAHAMALRVDVLRFDRLAPFPCDVEEVGFEEGGAAIDVGQLAAGAELQEEAMGLVQALQRVLVASVPAIQVSKFLRRFCLEDEITAFAADRFREEEVSLGFLDVAVGARNHAGDLLRIAVRCGVAGTGHQIGRVLPCLTGRVLLSLLDPKPGDEQLDANQPADVTNSETSRPCFGQRAVGLGEPVHVRVQVAEIVERVRLFVGEPGAARIAQG